MRTYISGSRRLSNIFWALTITLGGLGLPGTSGFIGEFLTLTGALQKNMTVAILSSLGVILAAAYMLWLYKRVIFGRVANSEVKELKDIEKTEFYILYLLAGLIIFFGFYPDPLFNTIDTSVNNLINNYEIDLNLHLNTKNN